jgi:uncharacterized membrane protein YfcA
MFHDGWAIGWAVLAVILSGLAKGGFAGLGSLAMPLMVMANPPLESAAVLLPILIVQDMVGVWSFRKTFDRIVLAVMIPGMTVGVILGYLFASRVSETAILTTVGALSLVFGLHRLWQDRGGAVVLPSNSPRWVGVLFGVASGFGSQIAHAGAPPFQMWVLPRKLPRDVLVGTNALAFAFMNLIKVPAYMALGQFTPSNLTASATLIPVALISTVLGVYLVRKIDAQSFYSLIYVMMIGVGLKLVLDGFGIFH